METEIENKILTDDETKIIDLLQNIHAEADEFEDPENGSFLDRMEKLIGNATEIDSNLFKIAVDRTHFFMGQWMGSEWDGDAYTVHPPTSAASDRLVSAAFKSNAVKDSGGVKGEILEIVDRLQVDYFWRDSDNPNPEVLGNLTDLFAQNNIKDAALQGFIEWSLLFPWDEFLGIAFQEVPAEHRLFSWNEQCKRFALVASN